MDTARKLFVAGNWKMNTSAASAVELANALAAELGATEDIDLAVFPPFVYLSAVAEVLSGTKIAVGAQDCFFEDNGAYTGEISTEMLADVGCNCVLCGHSERRHVIGESDQWINRKVLKAISGGLKPILCVGELLEQRDAGETADVVARQVRMALEGVSSADLAAVTIAYEPVWAIGTGRTATPDQAQEVHAMIRGLIGELYDAPAAGAIRIQYGGSVKPANARDLLGCEDIDGALVGGASLKSSDFAAIVAGGRS